MRFRDQRLYQNVAPGVSRGLRFSDEIQPAHQGGRKSIINLAPVVSGLERF